MLLRNGAQEFSSSTAAVVSFSFHHHHHHHHTSISPMLISFSSSIRVFRSLALSFSFSRSHHHNRHHHCIRTLSLLKPSPSHLHHHHHVLSIPYTKTHRLSRFCSIPQCSSSAAAAASIEQLSKEEEDERGFGVEEIWDFDDKEEVENESFASAANDLKNLPSAEIEVKDLEELPEQWRRAKLAWLCKELPSHKPATTIRLLNAQRKWITQEDVKYIAVHTMRIRENETAFQVYKWMLQQRRFRFDADLATKLADYMGKERKFTKCREIFNDIINQGIVPSESTFHILTVSYLSSSVQGCLEEACGIYNRMIQLGEYQPRLSLHNSLFKALVSKPGGSSKHFLKQAEFIFHNLETSGLEIPKDIYAGLIWLHSYQDKVDTERIAELRGEMQKVGFEEGKDVLVSILRAYSKEGNVEEVERTWIKLLTSDCGLPSQSFVYRMEVYAQVGDPMKSLDIFKGMQEHMGYASVAAYHKIIELMSKAQEMEIAETLMRDFVNSGLKPLTPSFIDLMQMYFTLNLHEKLEAAFHECLEKCNPNRTIYNLYLDSLVTTGNLAKAAEVFTQMRSTVVIGINSRSCNIILNGYLSGGENIEAEKIYDLMCQKKYDIELTLMDKMEYVLSLTRKVVWKPISLKLSKEQREILVGLLLGGLRIKSDGARRNHALCFEFDESSRVHVVLRRHIYEQFHEWLNPLSRPTAENEDIPYQFLSTSHSYFGFYADQFWPKGGPVIPKLIHRWLSPRVLAYWYMHAGHRTTSGDILLKLKGRSHEDVERIVKILKEKSLDCRVKRKGRVYWIGFLVSNSVWFWKLVEPYILDDLKDFLRADVQSLDAEHHINFDTDTDSDTEKVSDDCQSMDN